MAQEGGKKFMFTGLNALARVADVAPGCLMVTLHKMVDPVLPAFSFSLLN